MSRGTATRRRGLRAQSWEDPSPGMEGLVGESEQRAERLDAEVSKLQEALAEAEAWYRLLQADHASLEHRHGQVGRKAGQLQAEVDRLELKNHELEALVDRSAGSGRGAGLVRDDIQMNRINEGFRSLRRHKWASAAAVALATLLARDPSVQGLYSSALEKVRNLRGSNEPGPSGFVLYAAMIQARDEAEKARADYNDAEATLKGDALLEAQDRLRAVKARYRQARLNFLPELARQCDQAGVPAPREAMESLALLRRETKD